MLIDWFEELADDERNRLDPFDFFLSSKQLALKILELVLDVVFL